MSDVYTSAEETYAYSDAKARGRKSVLQLLVGILGVVFALELLLYLVLIPGFSPVKIVYEGMHQYRAEDLRRVMGVEAGVTWLKFDTAGAVSNLASFAGIEAVSIEKHFPDKVVISVTERVPVAVTLATVNGRSMPVLLDKHGVIFSTPEAASAPALPLVSGLPVEAHGNGMRIPKMYRALLEQIHDMTALQRKYFTALSEIHVLPKEYGSYDLVLYPIQSKQRVFLDRGLNEEALQYMIVALDVINSLDPNAAEIDLRHGSVSYRGGR